MVHVGWDADEQNIVVALGACNLYSMTFTLDNHRSPTIPYHNT